MPRISPSTSALSAPNSPQTAPALVDGTDTAAISAIANQVRQLDVSAEVALNAGDYYLPADYGVAHLVVKPQTKAMISFHVDGAENEPRVTLAEVRFVNPNGAPSPLVVTNPVEAETPQTGCFSGFTTWLKDATADVFIDGLYVNSGGQVTLRGEVRGLGKLIRRPIMRDVPDGRLPTLNLTLSQIATGNGVVSTGTVPRGSDGVDLNALTRELGKIVGTVNYECSVDTDSFALTSGVEGSRVTVGARAIHAEVSGQGSVGFISGGTPVLTGTAARVGVSLDHPVTGAEGPRPRRSVADSVDVVGSLSLGRGVTPGSLTGSGQATFRSQGTNASFGPFHVGVAAPLGVTLRFDDVSVDPLLGTFSLHGTGALPDSLPVGFDTVEIDVGDQGGEVILSGSSELAELRYSRKIPALI